MAQDSTKIPVGVVGVTGYTGMELLRLLTGHPQFELTLATSRKEAGQKLGALFPNLQGHPLAELVVTEPDPDQIAVSCRLAFLAVPHGTAMETAAALIKRGLKVVDLSADFRLKDPTVYAAWYGQPHTQSAILPEAVYGLIELNTQAIKSARLVANPGCYPTSIILGLYPALTHGLIEPDHIVADSKSGASGAGRGAKVGMLFCEVHDSFKAYNLGKHRHTPEIEQEISLAAGKEVVLSFNPHLLPVDRGILSTIYSRLKTDRDIDQIHALYKAFYADHPWVRVLPLGTLPETRWVRGTMFCDIGLVKDPRTKRLIMVTAIDNLCRGASGQALANANLMSGLSVNSGLGIAPLIP